MALIVDNLRLKELVAIAELNRPFYEHFVHFLESAGYAHPSQFVAEQNELKGYEIILKYLEHELPDGVFLYDGVARPYLSVKAKWLFLGWLFRDAPEQRLKPMLEQFKGEKAVHAQAALLNAVRIFVADCLPEKERWDWIPISEVIVDRLEGSRRSIKGTLIEVMVRRILTEMFAKNKLRLDVGEKAVKISGETYDVVVIGSQGSVLLPVKSRETMGGGHALLFTRDIYKSISVAIDAGYHCLPLVIAESWQGDLGDLKSEAFVYIKANPNQVIEIEMALRSELARHAAIFAAIV